MFWNSNASSPPIDTVLTKEDLNLNEVLEYENILQDLKSQNQKLIDFITRPDVLNDLVSLVITEPSPSLEENEKFRRSNLACEVLTTDIPRLNESLSEKDQLVKLFSFFNNDAPLNPLLASFVSRTLSILICRKVDQHWYSYQFTCLKMLEFLKCTENSSQLLLKHLGTSAIMDFTLKLLTQIEGNDMQQNLLDWLENVNFVENIVALFHPSVDADRQYNAAQLLCDTIRKLRGKDTTKPDPILSCIQSPMIIKKLLDYMLLDREQEESSVSESSIIGGITVLLALLESPPPSDQINRNPLNNSDNTGSGDPLVPLNPELPAIISVLVPYLPKLHDLLIHPPKKNPIKLACGMIEPPLGNTRLTVIKLISALISTNTPEVNEMIDKLDTVQVLLDLFFHYTWNNFLHSQVDKCLAFALNTPLKPSQPNPLITNIFIKCRLLQRILQAWQDNANDEGKEGGKRRGYMGHLTNIANSVLKLTNNDIGTFLFLRDNLDKDTWAAWKEYVEGTLKPMNEVRQKFLGGSHPSQTNIKDEDQFQAEFNNSEYPDEDSTIYKYMIDPLSYDTFPDLEYFSPIARDWGEEEETSEDAKPKKKATFFELCCAKKSLGNTFSDEVWTELPNEEVSTSSDEDEKAGNTGDGCAFGEPVKDPANPWQQAEPSESAVNDGWANFTSPTPLEDETEAAVLTKSDEKATHKNKEETIKTKDEFLVIQTKEESSSENVTTKSDNNANLNSFLKSDPIHEKELIDNFRFLSKQGMMIDVSKASTDSGDVNKSCSDSVPQSTTYGEESIKPEAPQDPV